ncbi:DUF4907 domain-containing protein [Flaviaesturariibacter amylovorans]|uniref:DUF4907 domain-containing protein n=1 Tax=Flaviaesturariibacter amylovorans TaxID=1084520 RepID=A0ABP8GFB3_9BACT
MTRLFLLLIACLSATGGRAQTGAARPAAATSTTASPYSKSKFAYKIIPAPGGTWCYDIYADGRMVIHQPSVPGLPGTTGFRNKESAEKVALLVMDKLRKGGMPPTIAIAEMKKLGAL